MGRSAMQKAAIGLAALTVVAATVVAATLIRASAAEEPTTGMSSAAVAGTTDETTPTTLTTVPTTTTTTTTTAVAAARATTTTSPKPTTTKAKPKSATPKPTTTTKPKPAVRTPCTAAARACIDLSANRSWLLDGAGNVTYGPVPITHGRAGWRTPAGTFRVQFKDIDHKSSLFNDAPMPYSVFFNGGIAFHAGSLREQSHGCIHLSTGAARTYYNTLRVGDVVQVVP